MNFENSDKEFQDNKVSSSKPPLKDFSKRKLMNKSLGRNQFMNLEEDKKNKTVRSPIFKPHENFTDKYIQKIKAKEKTLYPSGVKYPRISSSRLKSTENSFRNPKSSPEMIKELQVKKRPLIPSEYPPTYKKLIINTPSPQIITKAKRLQSQNSKSSSNENRESFKSNTSLVRKSVNGSVFQFDDKVSISNYRLESQLGKGAYAVVKLAYEKGSEKAVAIKSYDKYKLGDQHKLNNVRREISILRRLDHCGIAKLHCAFEDKRQIHLVMEFVGTVTLNKFLKGKVGRKVSEDDAKIIFKNLVSSIEYIHSQSISHRDIKLDNIMIFSSLETKLIDFGFSIVQHPEKKLRIFCGTPSFMSPEIVSKMSYDGLKADIWALGVLLFALTAGEFPFKALNEKDLFRKICACNPNYPSTLSRPLLELQKKMLKSNSFERLKATDVFLL